MAEPPDHNPRLDTLHIFVLSSFAITQPVLDQLSRKKVYLQDQSIGLGALVAVAAILTLLVPALLAAVMWALRCHSEKARQRAHTVIVYTLLALVLLPVAKFVRVWHGLAALPLALAAAAAATWAYRRSIWVRRIVTAASPAIIAFPVIFFLFSPIHRYLFAPDEAPEPIPIANPVPVVLVVFDEFCGMNLCDDSGAIDADRYPNFAALAATATWYRNASTVHLRTDKAVPAILAGIYPRPLDEATAADYPHNLFTALAGNESLQLTVFEPYSRLYPIQADLVDIPHAAFSQQLRHLGRALPPVYLRTILPRNLPVELPEVPFEWFRVQRPHDMRPDKQTGVFRYGWNQDRDRQFQHFLSLINGGATPRLYFSHLVAPHFPWCYLPSGHKYLPDDGSDEFPHGTTGMWNETWLDDELFPIHAYQRYLLQLGYVDRLVGQLIARLREIGLFDRCLLVITADHGASFRPSQSRRAPSDATLPDILSVPLFIKYPHQSAGSVSDVNAELIDILPTVLDVLGAAVPFPMDGVSLADSDAPRRDLKRFYGDDDTLEIDAAFTRKFETLEHMIELFGTGADPERLFRIGPDVELIGRRVDSLELAETARIEMKLNHTRRVLDESSDLSPVYFEGHIQPSRDLALPVHLAIAVNGTIEAVTRTYRDEPLQRFWTAIVPERSLRSGENDVQIFAVTRNGARLRLEPTVVR